MNLWTKLKFMRAFGALATDIRATDKVFAIADIMLKSGDDGPLRIVLQRAMSDAGFRECFEQKYQPKRFTIETLRNLPEGTLGRGFADHIISNNLSVDFFPPAPGAALPQYFGMRARQTHDIFHVLTGFDTSAKDEVALQAFVFAQFTAGLPAIVIAAGLLGGLLRQPDQLIQLMDRIVQGYEMGKRAKFLLGFPWEEHWQDSVQGLRAQFNIALTPKTSADGISHEQVQLA